MSIDITHNWGMFLRAEYKQTELQERIFSFVYCFCGLVALSAANRYSILSVLIQLTMQKPA